MNCGRKGNKNMKGKMKYIISVLSIILVVANSSNVFAAETSAGVSAEQIISIDAGKPTLETGKKLEEVLGIQNARATSMPNQTWDWSKGKYSGDFEISYEYSYTKYNFSGYSQYYVDTKAERDKWTAASNNYTVYLMKGSGQGTIVTSYSFNSKDWKMVRFYNLDPGTKYAVCFSKANDGSTLSGMFYIYP